MSHRDIEAIESVAQARLDEYLDSREPRDEDDEDDEDYCSACDGSPCWCPDPDAGRDE